MTGKRPYSRFKGKGFSPLPNIDQTGETPTEGQQRPLKGIFPNGQKPSKQVENDMAKDNTKKDVSNVETGKKVQGTTPISDQERVQKIVSSLKNLLETGEEWQRKSTSISGVSVIRLPESKTRKASLAVEINPLNDQGLPIKKKGVMIMNPSEVEAFQNVFSDSRIPSLVTLANDVSGIQKRTSSKSTDIIEI